ncbi:hypothetical protein [Aliivibrio finisterrensis]|uniref:Uncharacterized protein n=1 Tax=Aliivibrio finisterrensis TaxID=511998 RepID=A0A4Q5KPK9_9GAMM|nr:hypothetical protein [Aliivibrio finisterrensis]RYU47465.1 hypothetical protein ERW57_18410 [Aliivibrio finisterrensis]RYU48354.1 hypothetical protein ERW56_18580 [Aliivibrio finisterrensis]RYU53280.1 hypothetical protein ERW50_18710 [Aliivibrio finisterrensis]RYU78891.1 hypothetical protein ERW55_18705 [Aliivibrio finisterrensis]
MARPKSYTEAELIEVANEIIAKGSVPKGWQIKEILGRGRITSIQGDLERLVEEGRIVLKNNSSVDIPSNQQVIEQENVQLPHEIQEAYKLVESELSDSLTNLIINLNNVTNQHYEQLSTLRIGEANKSKDDAIAFKEAAEEKLLATEDRVRCQVEEREILEQENAELEEKLAELQSTNTDLNALCNKLQQEKRDLDVKIKQQNQITQNLDIKLSDTVKSNTVLTTQLEMSCSSITKLEDQMTSLREELDITRKELTETMTEHKEAISARKRSEKAAESLSSDFIEAKMQVKGLEEKLKYVEGNHFLKTGKKEPVMLNA